MKMVKARDVRPVKILQNTTKNRADYVEIRDAVTGAKLHRGQRAYITRLAKQRFYKIVNV